MTVRGEVTSTSPSSWNFTFQGPKHTCIHKKSFDVQCCGKKLTNDCEGRGYKHFTLFLKLYLSGPYTIWSSRSNVVRKLCKKLTNDCEGRGYKHFTLFLKLYLSGPYTIIHLIIRWTLWWIIAWIVQPTSLWYFFFFNH